MKAKCNIKPRTIFCHDNLDVLRGINDECIDLIYLDPPFNKQDMFTAPIGTAEGSISFQNTWGTEALKKEWVDELKGEKNLTQYLKNVRDFSGASKYSYLVFMAIRLKEMKRILKSTGSIYYHCDLVMSHYIKLLLDIIFGEDGFRNDISWCYTAPSVTKRFFPRKHDSIFFYVKDPSQYIFNADAVRVPYQKESKVGGKNPQKLGGYEMKKVGKSKLIMDWWSDIAPIRGNMGEGLGYPTQKPIALLERIIKASSNEGDIVLDPFCGSATTCIAAEKLDRKWIGIDISRKAYDIMRERLERELSADMFKGDPYFYSEPPNRSRR